MGLDPDVVQYRSEYRGVVYAFCSERRQRTCERNPEVHARASDL